MPVHIIGNEIGTERLICVFNNNLFACAVYSYGGGFAVNRCHNIHHAVCIGAELVAVFRLEINLHAVCVLVLKGFVHFHRPARRFVVPLEFGESHTHGVVAFKIVALHPFNAGNGALININIHIVNRAVPYCRYSGIGFHGDAFAGLIVTDGSVCAGNAPTVEIHT